ncbi:MULTISPECIES: nucleotidyltransferase [Clostridium]|uniref:nucleotidyltransferase n=1 Tax=Clostridium TaxID=1485 RepID=UPI000826DDF2|nr:MULTISPECIES: nucleotidyltransferase [Clostridium]PJI06626.1 nucleotidyltransferase [Clostridium sp. CT7]
MNISGIITEYNPMHMGHIYHLAETKKICKSDAVICVMSGNFVQRGEPALIDKWSRASAALSSGVDIVIELPVVYSLSSAEFFAYGAVSLLNSIGNVSSLCFGSETGDIKDIYSIAKILTYEPDEYKTLLKSNLKSGLSFPSSRTRALNSYLQNSNTNLKSKLCSDIISSPNNILAVEYCKSLIKLNSSIAPQTIKRQGNDYNDLRLKGTLSASAIRKALKSKNNISMFETNVPRAIFKILNENIDNLTYMDSIFNFIKYKILLDKNSLKKLPDVSEGIENKIYNSIIESYDMDSLINSIKNKRYTYSRISRILTQYFIGFDCYNTAELRKLPCPYARILGFTENGKKVLKLLKASSSIPLITKVKNYDFDALSLDLKATKAYSLINKKVHPLDDYYKKIIIA